MHMATHDNRTRDGRARVLTATEALEEDIQLAADTTVPVLISGPVPACRAVATEVERRSGFCSGSVEIIDCSAEPRRLESVLSTAGGADAAPGRCFLLEEVHALPPGDQLVLQRHLAEMRHAARPATRILASSSVSLFDRVEDQLFSERLYYLLNVIHIVVPAAKQMTRRMD